jgi:hypothetical protein
MKALGGTVNDISKPVLIEYGSVSVVSIAFGVALSAVLTSVWGNIFGAFYIRPPETATLLFDKVKYNKN